MPLLSELREFKASFNDIGGEKANLKAKDIPFDDLELPESEPDLSVLNAKTQSDEAETESTEEEVAATEAEAIPETTPPEATPIDDFDFSALIGAQPGDLPDLPSTTNLPDISTLAEAAAETEDIASTMRGSPPASDDLDNAGDSGLPKEQTEDFDFGKPDDGSPEAALDLSGVPAPDSGSGLDLDSLDNFDFPDDLTGSGDDFDFSKLDDFDLSSEPAPDESPSPDNVDLPEEPAATSADDLSSPPSSSEEFDFSSLDDLIPSGEPVSADDASDLDNLGDIGLPEEPAVTSADAEGQDSTPDSGGIPDLDNLSSVDLPEEPAASSEEFDFSNLDDLALSDGLTPADDSLDLDNLGGFDLPDGQASSGDDFDSLDDLALSAEPTPTDDNLDLDNLGGFDLPDGQTDSGDDFDSLDDLASAEPVPTDDNLDLDNLGGFDLPDGQTDSGGDFDSLDDFASAEPTPADDSLDLDNLSDFDLPDGQADSGDSPDLSSGDSDLDLDNLDDFDFDNEAASSSEDGVLDDVSLDDLSLDDVSSDDVLSDDTSSFNDEESIDLGTPDFANDQAPGGDSGGMDDFSFPDLDDVLKASKKADTPDISTQPRGKRRGRAKAKAPVFTPAENIDEIQLSEEDLQHLQKTLSGYPLNLRVACEEIIVEQVVEPEKLSKLIKNLVDGTPAKETALLAGHILGKMISIPKGFEKSSGEALEAEQASFAYIFVHNFLPVLRLFAVIAVIAGSCFYLAYNFVYLPHKAETIYKIGYERIIAGEYQRANERFTEAFDIHRKKNWFYQYAEAFRDQRQYIYAEQKYDELLRYYLRDKKGILDYGHLETYYLRNYAKADSILRRQLLDYAPNDYDGWLAVGDNSLIWGEIDQSKYEDARYAYARLLEKYGWKVPIVERMMQYFIRTDDLREVLYLKEWFDASKKRNLSAVTLAELGGYLLDKQMEEVRGVPNEYVEYIGGIRELLMQAVEEDPNLPESHYHLARFYHNLGGVYEEQVTLERAIDAFDNAREETIRRLNYRIDAHQRYADLLISIRKFFPAEEQLVKGINLYEDALERRLMSRSAQYGRLYAGLGDLEYFTKISDMEAALRYYHRSEQNGWAPPEMQYRMGSAYYQLENWRSALEYFFSASSSLPLNSRILFSLGNTALKRGDYFASFGYYNRLLNILENQRSRMPVLLSNDRPEYLELAERLMMARNNAGVACEMLAAQTGDRSYQTRALAFYAEAERAWDARTRDPTTLIRSGGTPLPYLNARNALYPVSDYEPQIFIRIDREAFEDSQWERIAPIAWLDLSRSN
jgi:tetratricopeptide (TPR) repeat protein